MMNTVKTSKEQVEFWDSVLDDYEKGIGLPNYSNDSLPEEELQQYLTMNRNVLEKLDIVQCAEIAYRIGQYGFHVQRTLNREQARMNWAENEIKITIADEINNYKGYGYIEKSSQAIKHNDKANQLNKIVTFAKQRMDRLTYLSSSLKNLSDILISIQRAKGMVKNG